MAIEDVLIGLGVELARGSDREIRGYCPVHHLVKGRPDSNPSWYMNRATGAWLCFSCHQGGSLPYLVELLGGDNETLREVKREALGRTIQTIEELRAQRVDEEEDVEPAKPEIYISDYGFTRNPLPPKYIRKRRDIKGSVCERFNLRWNIEEKCFLIPLYDCATHTLIGWQEKASGYFMNVPEGVDKSLCLYGYQQYSRGDLVVVESPLDVIRLGGHTVADRPINAVATMGSYVSKQQLDAIAAAVPDNASIILAFDDDEAGDIATTHVYRALRAMHLAASLKVFKYPLGNRRANGTHRWGKDPGELPIEYVVAGIETAGRAFISIKPPPKNRVTA